MDDIVIDTHIVIWYFTGPKMQSNPAQSAIVKAQESGSVIYVPSITIVELTYLIEKNRVPADVAVKLREALDDDTTAFSLVELTRGVADDVQRIDRSIVGDMPDRIIAATALHLGLPLITSDGNIQKLTNVETIW
ncbi:MAG: type II toxin-antitoxin system VapC family toxin [Pyrinomonadaceae bacterium]